MRAYHRPYGPEEAGAWALPQGEFGLDVIALIGQLRYARAAQRAADRTRPCVAQRGSDRRAQRDRVAASLRGVGGPAPGRCRRGCARGWPAQGGVILALDGLQPDVGHEVLVGAARRVSGEPLLARSLLGRDRRTTWRRCSRTCTTSSPGERPEDAIPIRGVISDGQQSPSARRWRSALPGRAAPALPVSLPARGGAANLRGRPACQEGAEEARARRAPD